MNQRGRTARHHIGPFSPHEARHFRAVASSGPCTPRAPWGVLRGGGMGGSWAGDGEKEHEEGYFWDAGRLGCRLRFALTLLVGDTFCLGAN